MPTPEAFRAGVEMTPGRLASDLDGLRSLFGSAGLDGQQLVPATYDRVMHAGSTAVSIQSAFVQAPSGLWVPQKAVQPTDLLDRAQVYLTSEEAFGVSFDANDLRAMMRRLPVSAVLWFVGHWLTQLHRPGADRALVDVAFVEMVFQQPHAYRVLNLLRNPQTCLLAPQVLLALAKLGLALCEGDGDASVGDIATVMFGIATRLGDTDAAEIEESPDNTAYVIDTHPGPIGKFLAANQLHNRSQNVPSLVAAFRRRWLQLPNERADDKRVVPLADEFGDITGVPLTDFLTIGLLLVSAVWAHGTRVDPAYLAELAWDTERVDRAMSLYTVEVDTLRAEVIDDIERYGFAWSTSAFERFPVARLVSGALLVLDPQLLLRRLFGWLPLFDMLSVLDAAAATGDRKASKRANKIKDCLRHLSEVYALEILPGLATAGNARRHYDDEALKAAFAGKGVKVADAAIDYGDVWLVVEVTTSQVTRAAAAGVSEEALEADLDKMVAKARQLDSTIRCLRANESALTGQPAVPARRFLPLLVAAEGFPVNPITMTNLRARIRDLGLLAGSDVQPLDVVDIEELDMVEGLQEFGGPTLRELLESKAASSHQAAALKDYVLLGLRLATRRPQRAARLTNFVEFIDMSCLVTPQEQDQGAA